MARAGKIGTIATRTIVQKEKIERKTKKKIENRRRGFNIEAKTE